ncbi:MAG: ribose-phosphate pyrophosphokinase [Candidatus Glassbacteria bacterium GWA2_58_10]|uniref:Ribose-phosphate pyrophosphokinase n=1 Tax=Candidatus Glassbacteria bacterium GWA2_58_10 TaxID=1817865 RepID=A0A1F5YEL0_9BACT|nr:MAG: ribose-phosphate pyrophosphokinase [Candidatus Glassbacteria bacterium GWA2_58_10]
MFSHIDLKLISGNANRKLAEDIAAFLEIPLCQVEVKHFSDGEIFIKILENIRGRDCFVIQPTNPPAENIMELLLIIDALRRSSAGRITAVIPYYGYGRQDRKDQPRVGIGAKLTANLITMSGADRVMMLDLHSHQIQGFFDIPSDHLYTMPIFLDYFRSLGLRDVVVVTPDIGGAKMARGYAGRLDAPLAFIEKRRPRPNVAQSVNIVGEVTGRDVVMVDDIIDTGGTMSAACQTLLEKKPNSIHVGCTHAVLSGLAVEILKQAPLTELAVTDTIQVPPEKRFSKLKVLSVAELLGKAIRFIHEGQSVSALFVD